MITKTMEQYVAFRKRINFFTIYSVDQERIAMQICKNVSFQQPYSIEWHTYIKKTCLLIYPKLENPLLIFNKLYHKAKIQQPMVKAFQT